MLLSVAMQARTEWGADADAEDDTERWAACFLL